VVVVVVENLRLVGILGSPGNREVYLHCTMVDHRRRGLVACFLLLLTLVAHFLHRQNPLGWVEVHDLLPLVVHKRIPNEDYVSPRAHGER
jgi:hypothetical protein